MELTFKQLPKQNKKKQFNFLIFFFFKRDHLLYQKDSKKHN